MSQWVFILHIAGAVGMGVYVWLPWWVRQSIRLPFAVQTSAWRMVYRANFFSQWILVLQMFTGGYLLAIGDHPILWVIGVLIAFLAIGGFGGMFGLVLRRFDQEGPDPRWIQKIKRLADGTAISFFVILLLMLFRPWF
ncbi:hypothetical protein GCM10011571_30720 [Marinithermofilum abyssi]|uniref:DUF2269 family protein n=1 Tax=Marinithermofilum abyssi TaxID=1571185 RepID=A0A8J2VCL9_9BACL|nr:hypothetical protein [Marinithermofilum abyssi]GGE26373.1 hypothetical protein GCM10011571_30720 [Marinithermofilum abyssi]